METSSINMGIRLSKSYVIFINRPERDLINRIFAQTCDDLSTTTMFSKFKYGFLGTTDIPIMVSITIFTLFIIFLFTICYHLADRGKELRS